MEKQPKTTILIIRHGETLWNIQSRFQGHGDSPLTETGRRQATALGKRLRNVHFDKLICSDLSRAKETAALIAEQTDHGIMVDPRLRERNYGVLEGLTAPEIEGDFPEVFSKLLTFDPDFTIPEGESHREHYQRNIAFLKEFVSRNAGETAAIVVHGGVLDSIFRFVAGLPLRQPRCFATANAGLSIVSHGFFFRTVRWVIETWCDVAHLDGMEKGGVFRF